MERIQEDVVIGRTDHRRDPQNEMAPRLQGGGEETHAREPEQAPPPESQRQADRGHGADGSP